MTVDDADIDFDFLHPESRAALELPMFGCRDADRLAVAVWCMLPAGTWEDVKRALAANGRADSSSVVFEVDDIRSSLGHAAGPANDNGHGASARNPQEWVRAHNVANALAKDDPLKRCQATALRTADRLGRAIMLQLKALTDDELMALQLQVHGLPVTAGLAAEVLSFLISEECTCRPAFWPLPDDGPEAA